MTVHSGVADAGSVHGVEHVTVCRTALFSVQRAEMSLL